MKIAIPVEEKIVDKGVYDSFGRAPFFMIYDNDSRESVYIDNGAIASQGGAGIKAAQTLVDENIDVLLTPRCGENAAEVLEMANIEIYKSTTGTVKNNIELFQAGQLAQLTEIHAGLHGHTAK